MISMNVVPNTNISNGGINLFATKVPYAEVFVENEFESENDVAKAGQVAKKYSLVYMEPDTGKLVLSNGVSEAALVNFSGSLTGGQTLILAGLTWTAALGGTTPEQLVAAFKDITVGTGYASLSTRTDGGSFTAGTSADYNIAAFDDNTLIFNATTALTNATDLAATGTGASVASISIKQGTTSKNRVKGVLMYDLDTTAGDQKISYYSEGHFWAEKLVWAVDPSVDYIINADGEKVFCTAYNTGAFGDSETANRMKKALLHDSEIEISFSRKGEL